jgi:hypothetical protein
MSKAALARAPVRLLSLSLPCPSQEKKTSARKLRARNDGRCGLPLRADCPLAAAKLGVGCAEQTNLIQTYTLLAKGAKGKAAIDLVGRVVEEPGLYVFGEILDCPNIAEVRPTIVAAFGLRYHCPIWESIWTHSGACVNAASNKSRRKSASQAPQAVCVSPSRCRFLVTREFAMRALNQCAVWQLWNLFRVQAARCIASGTLAHRADKAQTTIAR